ncbi:MAG: hypothetical protein NTV36_01420, partial [Candidatus Staskawiczbacteria bacterium]|nr:hypothetical protein [Candidatus Staskawiczbacteria bacterium]
MQNPVKFWFAIQAQKEVTFFKNSKYQISFKPFYAYQGLAVLIVILISLTVAINVVNPKKQDSLAIKSSQTKQLTAVVAGVSQPVQWTTFVNKSDIAKDKQGSYILKLPKQATNVKVQTITKQQAGKILKQQKQNTLSLIQRQTLVKSDLTKTSLKKNKGFFASITGSFFADLEQGATDVIQNIVETVVPEPEVTVDLSAELPADNSADTPSDDGVVTPSADVVQVTYETPAPTITEQATDTGKLVTVSSATTEQVDCEAFNPNKITPTVPEVLNTAGAGLLNGFLNFFKSIIKFFTADLEHGASDAVQAIVDQVVPPAPDAPAEPTPPAETPAPEVAPTPEPEAAAEAPSPNQSTGSNDGVATPADSAYQQCLASQAHLTDVIASTTIPEIYKVGQEDKIKIKWKSENNQEVAFHAYDKDNNGKLDYVEWTVPHLSDQVFEIIFISKAWELNENKEIVNDIYDQVATQDQIYATVPQDHYIRATFKETLDNTRDITIFAKPTAPSSDGATAAAVEVYPVYTDESGNQTQGLKLDLVNDGANPDFSNIDHDGKYRMLLTNLQTSTDVFDLKIIDADVDVDYIVD